MSSPFLNDAIDSHTLVTEHGVEETLFTPVGRAVVDIGSFWAEIQRAVNHEGSETMGCTFANLRLTGQHRDGLHYTFKFRCNMCNYEGTIDSDNQKHGKMDVNTAAVSGALAAGIGHRQMEEIMMTMNIPFMCDKTFIKYEDTIRDALLTTALQEMNEAAKEEKRLALEMGDVDEDGTALITVVADGSWAKRSYKTKYDSLSGTAAIMGCRTKKVLFLAVRNKYCTVCARSINQGKEVKEHKCYKNWSGSSSAMETSIIVEGFQRSMEMYGVKYNKFIADGDASVYNELVKRRPYRDLPITKIECSNHLLRNYCRKLRLIVENTKLGPKKLRTVVSNNIMRLRVAVNAASQHWQNQSGPLGERTSRLKCEILNSPNHVFGEHGKCDKRYCQGPKHGEINSVPSLIEAGIWSHISDAVRYLARHGSSLIQRLTSNIAENFNTRLAKVTGGKRVNYCGRGSYTTRCMSAVVSHNSNAPQSRLHRAMFKGSPGYFVKRLEAKRSHRNAVSHRSRKNQLQKSCQKKLNFSSPTDKSTYGPFVNRPDLPQSEYESEAAAFLATLRLTPEAAQKLETATVEQHSETLWVEERRKRITASNFGKILKRRATTPCEKLVKDLLYRPPFDSPALKYGRESEEEARQLMSQTLGVEVRKCGLFIDEQYPYLGASPDGLVGEDGIAEIKCPQTLKDEEPNDAIAQGKFPFLKMEDGRIEIKKNHNFYFQIQGQLNISKKAVCYFGLYAMKKLVIVDVRRDENLWETSMVPRLTQFYMNCVLPELVDPRHTRSMKIREPDYILRAIEAKKPQAGPPGPSTSDDEAPR